MKSFSMIAIATIGIVCGQSPVSHAEGNDAPQAAAVMLTAGPPRLVRPRTYSNGRQATRTYRSYSVAPNGAEGSGTPDAAESAVPSAAPMAPSGGSRSYSAPRSSGRSRPSYMRADSKANGRFGQ